MSINGFYDGKFGQNGVYNDMFHATTADSL